MPDLVECFARDGVETVGSTPEHFRAYLNAEMAKWKQAVASAPGFLKP